MSGRGWIGMISQVRYYLATVGADRDAAGAYLITGAPVTVGIGGDECVIPAATCYLVDGKPCGLAAGLASTSYGFAVRVI